MNCIVVIVVGDLLVEGKASVLVESRSNGER